MTRDMHHKLIIVAAITGLLAVPFYLVRSTVHNSPTAGALSAGLLGVRAGQDSQSEHAAQASGTAALDITFR